MDTMPCLPARLFFYKHLIGRSWPKGFLRDLFTGSARILRIRCCRMVTRTPKYENQGFLHTLLLLFYEFIDVPWFLPVYKRQTTCNMG
jgi:hypothetical protein